jgi:hypothetical protein
MTRTRMRGVPTTMVACLLAGPAMGCASEGGALAAVGGGTGEQRAGGEQGDPCARPESDHAMVDVWDLWRGDEYIPVDVIVDGCVTEDSRYLVRGSNEMTAVAPGDHTLSIVVDGRELPPQEFSAEAGDEVHFVMDAEFPPAVYRTQKTLPETADAWQVNLLNMTGEPVTISRATDPAGTEYEVVEADIPHGGAFAGELPVFAESGVPIRVESGGQVVREENIGYFLDCRPGSWTGWTSVFAVIEDVEDTDGLPFRIAGASSRAACR